MTRARKTKVKAVRKLIAPGITSGEWRVQESPVGRDIVSNIDGEIAWSSYGDLDFCLEMITPENARFLANSKRVSEAAALVLALPYGQTQIADLARGIGTATENNAWADLRAALIAQGYREE